MPSQFSEFSALVLDDDQEIVEEVAEAITIIGGTASTFCNPIDCLDHLKLLHPPYDFVIVDLAMPIMSGVDFLKAASLLFTNSPKQILITGLAELGGENIECSGSLTVLQKPIRIGELKDQLGRPA